LRGPALSTPAISVVVSARDAASTIERAVAAMVEQDGAVAHEVVVVDNASQDDTGALAAARGARVVRLDDRRGGPGQARNAGVAAARAPLIAFTDADCYPTTGWLAAMVAGFDDADVVAGPVLPDPTAPDRTHWDRTVSFGAASPLYPTANLAVRRDLFEHAGGFADWVLHADGSAPSHPYGEDTVLAWTLIRGGARAAFAPEAVVHHAVFDETASRWVRRHLELRHLPELVRQIPELRGTMLEHGVFASKRTMAASLALGGVAAALATRSALPLAAAGPLAFLTVRRTRAMGPTAAAVWTAADVASSGALMAGSVRARALVL
jgi:glycosyltransferase involved in cell wall biosynthesis